MKRDDLYVAPPVEDLVAALCKTLLNRYDLYTADEAFLTGTAAEVAPIRMVDGRIIGAGKIGPVTRDIRARFQELVKK